MTDQDRQPQAEQGDAATVEQDAGNDLQETFDREYVEKLRRENAKWRTTVRELEDQQKQREEQELAEQQKWRELAEKRERELSEYKPFKDQYESMLESTRESNQRRIEAIPENMRSLVPEYDDPARLSRWLDQNASVLSRPAPASMDATAGNGQRPKGEPLSEEEYRIAKSLGISPENYAKRKLNTENR